MTLSRVSIIRHCYTFVEDSINELSLLVPNA